MEVLGRRWNWLSQREGMEARISELHIELMTVMLGGANSAKRGALAKAQLVDRTNYRGKHVCKGASERIS